MAVRSVCWIAFRLYYLPVIFCFNFIDGIHLRLYLLYTWISQEQGVLEKWTGSAWAKKIENKKKRAALTDFDRFKVMIAKKQKSQIVAAKVAELA
jgi:hypothetical protein